MRTVISLVQIIISGVVIVLILLQVKGTGFGRVWGANSTSFTRRGLEKLVFKLTFVFTLLFAVLSFLSLLV